MTIEQFEFWSLILGIGALIGFMFFYRLGFSEVLENWAFWDYASVFGTGAWVVGVYYQDRPGGNHRKIILAY